MTRVEIRERAESIIENNYGPLCSIDSEKIDIDEVILVLKDEYDLEDDDYLREIVEEIVFG